MGHNLLASDLEDCCRLGSLEHQSWDRMQKVFFRSNTCKENERRQEEARGALRLHCRFHKVSASSGGAPEYRVLQSPGCPLEEPCTGQKWSAPSIAIFLSLGQGPIHKKCYLGSKAKNTEGAARWRLSIIHVPCHWAACFFWRGTWVVCLWVFHKPPNQSVNVREEAREEDLLVLE